MTKLTPSFNGVEIREGDTGTIRITFAGTYADGTLRVSANVLGNERFAAVEVESIASHTPAPRPLVPGPAVLDGGKAAGGFDVEVTAVGRDFALVVGYIRKAAECVVERNRLRNTEGTAS
jgi:hypothetical protein